MEKTVSGPQYLRAGAINGLRPMIVCFVIISLFGLAEAFSASYPVMDAKKTEQQRSLNDIYLEKILNWFH